MNCENIFTNNKKRFKIKMNQTVIVWTIGGNQCVEDLFPIWESFGGLCVQLKIYANVGTHVEIVWLNSGNLTQN